MWQLMSLNSIEDIRTFILQIQRQIESKVTSPRSHRKVLVPQLERGPSRPSEISLFVYRAIKSHLLYLFLLTHEPSLSCLACRYIMGIFTLDSFGLLDLSLQSLPLIQSPPSLTMTFQFTQDMPFVPTVAAKDPCTQFLCPVWDPSVPTEKAQVPGPN
jgi:hypothetical protein